jgi:hypothetical protein
VREAGGQNPLRDGRAGIVLDPLEHRPELQEVAEEHGRRPRTAQGEQDLGQRRSASADERAELCFERASLSCRPALSPDQLLQLLVPPREVVLQASGDEPPIALGRSAMRPRVANSSAQALEFALGTPELLVGGSRRGLGDRERTSAASSSADVTVPMIVRASTCNASRPLRRPAASATKRSYSAATRSR